MEKRKAIVAVVGDGIIEPGSTKESLAEDLGRRLVDHGYRLLTGGLGGVMAAAARGARGSSRHAPGDIVGILPEDDAVEVNPWIDIAIPTGLGHARNTIVARADAVVAVGGGAGTLSEICFAWLHDRLVIALECAGWSGRVAGTPLDERKRFETIPDDRIWSAADPAQVLILLEDHLPRYRAALELS